MKLDIKMNFERINTFYNLFKNLKDVLENLK